MPADTRSSDPSRPTSRRTARRAAITGVLVVGGVIVLAGGLYLNRRLAAERILVGWLERQGVPAEVSVERFELNGFTGRIRVGDAAAPVLIVDRVEVDYAVGAPWSRDGFGVTPSRVRLVAPVLNARWTGDRLSLGALDPIVQRFTARPPRPDARSPVVIVDRGRLHLTSDYGTADVLADARLDNGKLLRLVARMPPATLRSGPNGVEALQASVDLTTRGDRVALRVQAGAGAATSATASGQDVRLNLEGDLPYPDTVRRRGDGQARLKARLTAGRAISGTAELRDAVVDLLFNGRTQGWIDAFDIAGRTSATVTADRAAGAGVVASRGRLTAAAPAATRVTWGADGLSWSIEGPLALNAASLDAGDLSLTRPSVETARARISGRDADVALTAPLRMRAASLTFGDLRLGDLRSAMTLDGSSRTVRLSGSVSSPDGAWPLFGAATGDDPADLVEIKRALGAFSLDAPSIRLDVGADGAAVRLGAPVRIAPRNGGLLQMLAADTPVYAARPGGLGGGALSIVATRGRGLPEGRFAIPEWRLTPDGWTARLDGQAGLDFDIARDLRLRTAGRLTSAGGRLAYAPTGCIPLTIAKLELDENDIDDVAGSLCPGAAPFFALDPSGWRLRGGFVDTRGAAPFLESRFRDAAGTIAVDGATGGGLSVEAAIRQATLEDAATPRRFNSLNATGAARLADERWSGRMAVSSGAHPVATVDFAHDGGAQAGGLSIDTGDLVFAEGGLQPATLSPLAAEIVTGPATGQARFTGRFDWTADTSTSSGVVSIPGLDLPTPAGQAHGLKGEIVFTSLAPLTTAPNQVLRLDRLDSVTPLTDLTLDFGLDASAFVVSGAETRVGGGSVRVEPVVVPFDRAQTVTGALVFDKVQLGDLVSGAGLEDKVDLDAVVSGRIPFTVATAGVRFAGGRLEAVQPGRLSIRRDALQTLEAAGGGEAVPEGAIQDLAYQALENLAFDLLTADVNSDETGRLQLLFHIRGRHDPPQKQEIRLSWIELATRRFLNRPLPLPSGTGIDLNLNTYINADQLASDLLALNRARRGETDGAP